MANCTGINGSDCKHKERVIVIHGNSVYDVSDFTQRHPGGPAALTDSVGTDVEQLMTSSKSHVHTHAAYQILRKYYIGSVDELPDLAKSLNGKHKFKNGIQKATYSPSLPGYKEDELVDWNKPILWQVGRLGRDYDEWVHSPTDRPLRLFQSDFVEYFSATPWWAIPIVWIPVMLSFIYVSLTYFQQQEPVIWQPVESYRTVLHIHHMVPLFACGVLLWTFLEYVVHRWLFHMSPPHNSTFLITVHFLLHGQHHKCPFDKGRLVFPPVAGSVFAILFWAMYTSLFPPAMAYILLAGTTAGYMGYDMTHYYLHHGTPSLNYFRYLKSNHVKHHFTHQHLGFGISCRLWDYPFGTLIKEDSAAKVK